MNDQIPLETRVSVIDNSSREELMSIYQQNKKTKNDLLKKIILENNRIDILATQVLGYELEPMHLKMLQYQLLNDESLMLVFRGSGKTTICTIAYIIFVLLKDPNLRICIASKTLGQAESFLKPIKNHFEDNDKLEEIFGTYYDPRIVSKWGSKEIEVLPRTVKTKEASITCVSTEGAVVGKHFDMIISDDLVDETNTSNKVARNKVKSWYYQTLTPCLEPPDDDIEFRGKHHVIGTRYHFDDLYGHLMENEFTENHLIIRAIEDGKSPWPGKYPVEWFLDVKTKVGSIIFNAQYQNDTESMKGEIFQYDQCQQIRRDQYPSLESLQIYMGVDLAISLKEINDQFAIVVIGIDKDGRVYVLDRYMGRLEIGKQEDKFWEFYDKYKPILAGIESNAYQAAFAQTIRNSAKERDDKNVRVLPIVTTLDKLTRAYKLVKIFENMNVFFVKDMMDKLIEQFILFPAHNLKDGFDAFDIAYRVGSYRRKRKPRKEPGVL